MFKNLILLLFFPFYPDIFFGPLLFLVLIFSIVLFFWKREKIILKLFSLSYIFSFLGLCLTTFFVKFQTLGANPVFRDQFVDAKGFPLAVLTYDAGMTDPNFHSVVLVMNLVFYFIIFTTLLLVIFRKKLKIIPMRAPS